MSKIADDIEIAIRRYLPSYRYIKEHYISYGGSRLFFDFYIPDLKIVIEVQGQQHYSFSKFFHGNVENFRKQKDRDSKKEEWCQLNNYLLITFDTEDVNSLNKEKFMKKILGA